MNANLIYCQQCGQPNDPRSKFCHNCGSGLVQSPQGAPPPDIRQPAVQNAPAKQSRSCLSNCLIISLVLVCLGIAAITAAGFMFGEEIMTTIEGYLTPEPNSPGTTVTGTGETTVSGSNSISVTSAVEGVVTAANGASITIPTGAVPVMDDGNAGTMVFSIQEDTSLTPTLPGEFESAGPVYHLGPEGFVFTSPVMLTLPIPQEIDPELVLGVTFFDAQANEWKLLPGTVNTQARTVSAETTHFSTWGIFGHCFSSILSSCANQDNRSQWQRDHGGWFKIVNNHRRGGST